MERKIFVMWIFATIMIVSSVIPSGQGSFQNNFNTKSFKISLKTEKFLKNVIALQQQLLKNHQTSDVHCLPCASVVQSVLQLNQQILEGREIAATVRLQFLEMVRVCKTHFLNTTLRLNYYQMDQTRKDWWSFLEKSLEVVQLQGHQTEFKWLCCQIASLLYDQTLEVKKRKAVEIVAVDLCLELMQRFNGLLVTEYDFIVLGNLAVGLLAMEC